MCPSYMATKDEDASTRGRANALRLAMTGQLWMQCWNTVHSMELPDLSVDLALPIVFGGL